MNDQSELQSQRAARQLLVAVRRKEQGRHYDIRHKSMLRKLRRLLVAVGLKRRRSVRKHQHEATK